MNLEDGFAVLENVPNTPKYWQKAKYEMLARLDNIGPFQFFFTLSCADLRWDENFATILRKQDCILIYQENSDGTSSTLVKKNKEDKECWTINDFLEKFVDKSQRELIRKNIFIASRNYNHRVKSFIQDIVRDKNNPMMVKNFSTKVEYQGRGAGNYI